MAKKNEIVKADSALIQPLEDIENLIHVIRGKQVMLDRDLARLYGVETRVLNQAVQRNIERFPGDFMFQLSKEDVEFLKSQNVILETGTNMSSQSVTTSDEFLRSQIVTLEKVDMRGKHVKFLPYAFTENGIAMLSGVLRSQQAININIQIMRAFNAMRHFIATNAQVFQRLEVIEHTQLSLIDAETFDMLDVRAKGVTADIYSDGEHKNLRDMHNAGKGKQPVNTHKWSKSSHDRWVIIDDTLYHCGHSVKDLGKKLSAIMRMDWNPETVLKEVR